jgi:hypothetical protein
MIADGMPVIHLPERFERGRYVLLAHPNAGVGNRYRDVCPAAIDANADLPAPRSELQRIGQQIQHHLTQPFVVRDQK